MPGASMSSSNGPPPPRSTTQRRPGRSPWVQPRSLTDSVFSSVSDTAPSQPADSTTHPPGFIPLSIRGEGNSGDSMASSVYAKGVYDGKDPRPHQAPGARGKREKRKINDPPQEDVGDQGPTANDADIPHSLGFIPPSSSSGGGGGTAKSHYTPGVYNPADLEATRDPNTHDTCPSKGKKKEKEKLTHPLGRIPKACVGVGGRMAKSHYKKGVYYPADKEATKDPNVHDGCADASLQVSEIELAHPLGRIPRACGGGIGRNAESYYIPEKYNPYDIRNLHIPSGHDECPFISPHMTELKLAHPLGRIPKACGGGNGRTAESHYIPEKYNPYTPEGIHVESTHDFCTYRPKKIPMELDHPLGKIPASCSSSSGATVAQSHYVPEDYDPYTPEGVHVPSTHDSCWRGKSNSYPGGNYHDFPPSSNGKPKLNGRERHYPLGYLPKACRTEQGRNEQSVPSYYDDRYDPFSSISLIKPSTHDKCAEIPPEMDSKGNVRSSVMRNNARYNPRLEGENRLYPLGYIPEKSRSKEKRKKPMVDSSYNRGKYSKENAEAYATKLADAKKKEREEKRKKKKEQQQQKKEQQQEEQQQEEEQEEQEQNFE